MVTKVADYCQKREWCSLAKAGRTIYPTMGSLKARPLQINNVACVSHLLQVKRLERDDVVLFLPLL